MSCVFVDMCKSFSINELRRCGGRFAVTRSVSTSYDDFSVRVLSKKTPPPDLTGDEANTTPENC